MNIEFQSNASLHMIKEHILSFNSNENNMRHIGPTEFIFNDIRIMIERNLT